MTDDKKAEIYLELYRLARNRFEKRYSYGWKMVVTICAAFGVAAGFIVNSDLTIPLWAPWPIGAASLLIAWSAARWTRLQREYDEIDSRTTYYWESAMEKLVDENRPKGLRKDEWIRYGETDTDKLDKKPKADLWHPHLITQISMPFLFAGLLILAMIAKIAEPNKSSSTLTIKSQDTSVIDVDKLRIAPSKSSTP
ncbi:MAG TPA: hypothetical protein VMJ32_14790 [Pirellulales bacterium]|nr:hypothetical protein [Pirellulales bacterium]